MIRFCFTRLGVPLVSNPSLQSFSAHSHANDFANPANPVLTPWFIFIVQMMVREELGGGGWGGVGEDLSLTMYFFTAGPTQIYTSQPFSLHCNKKFIHVAGDHHGSRQNIRLVRTIRVSQKIHGGLSKQCEKSHKMYFIRINTH